MWTKEEKKEMFAYVYSILLCSTLDKRGWSGGAMVLGELPVPGRPTKLG